MAEQTDAGATGPNGHQETSADLLRELVAHLRANRTQLRQEWARRIGEAGLLTALTQEEIFSQATSVYDNYRQVLETGSGEGLRDHRPHPLQPLLPPGLAPPPGVGHGLP